ncbi:MAG: hypothetical protein BGO20_17310 [Bosea sp. 67-29]|nr:MAG: hypothetical protein BGO20_17310 [Bosea sp. 67-29]
MEPELLGLLVDDAHHIEYELELLRGVALEPSKSTRVEFVDASHMVPGDARPQSLCNTFKHGICTRILSRRGALSMPLKYRDGIREVVWIRRPSAPGSLLFALLSSFSAEQSRFRID